MDDLSVRYYVASPLFNSEQINYIKEIEQVLKDKLVDEFSPRMLGGFRRNHNLTNLETSLISSGNVRGIDSCEGMVANVKDYGTGVDIGTLWEIGYFLNKYIDTGSDRYSHGFYFNRSKKNKLILLNDEDGKVNEAIMAAYNIVIELGKYYEFYQAYESDACPDSTSKVFLHNGNVSEAYQLGKGEDFYYDINETISFEVGFCMSGIYICIDDHNLISSILLGMLHGHPYIDKIGLYTYSLKGYGSNIMIHNNIDGHYIFNKETKSLEVSEPSSLM